MNKLLSSSFADEIEKMVIKKVFPLINNQDSSLLVKLLQDLIIHICVVNCFDIINNYELYYGQFIQNDYMDLKGLLLILLPYINTKNSSTDNIKSIKEIYNTRDSNDTVNDLNKGSPLYKYSNFQYERFNRETDNYKEYTYTDKLLMDNYTLLKKTISIISNKLYINWVDIRPYTINNYYKSLLYRKTIESVNDGSYYILENHDVNREYTETNIKTLQFLYVGDYYNTMVNYLYKSIKNNKWIIYEIYNENIFKPFITLIAEIVPIDDIVNSIQWNHLDTETQNNITLNWKRLLGVIEGQKLTELSISPHNILSLLHKFIYFFDKYYKNRDILYKSGKYKGLGSDKIININTIDKEILNNALMGLDVMYVYEYIKQVMDKIRPTWYFNRLVKYENHRYRIIRFNEYRLNIDMNHLRTRVNTKYVSLKLLYNYVKSLTKQKQTSDMTYDYPRYWRSCDNDTKKIILDRLSCNPKNSKNSKWFNITRNLERVFKISGKLDQMSHIEAVNMEIHITIKKVLTDIIFNILIENGILSQFVPEPYITNIDVYSNNLKSTINKQQITRLKEKVLSHTKIENEWNNANYYLTNEPYNRMSKVLFDGNQKIPLSYLEYIGEGISGDWFTNYAMNWISQISFFHRYIHSRVMYVTGGTGVGKSSQIPKLVLYSLKMVDYKLDGQVVCTMPRIPPVTSSSDFVAKQLGVPIEKYIKNVNHKIKTSNYNVQYKHSEGSHCKDINNLTLKFVTDGTLYQEILVHPILKKKVIINNKSMLLNENLYDVVLVDEAHEHNINMDMILTLMKYAVYYNNDIRLIIVSATMDDDEYMYRRYYRDINHNRLYPFDNDLKELKIDRINIERRIHISPPGSETRFNIEEHYIPNGNIMDIIRNDIIPSPIKGDVLIFQPGQGDIIKLVSEINGNTPPDIIAIPYFSEMKKAKKSFVEKLSDKSKRNFTIPKTIEYHTDFDESKIEHVATDTYKRIIIVATNIAEASITIDSLRFIIEDGKQKINIYNPEIKVSVLTMTQISESSRLQRKGRVGRVAPGTVYYLYEEGLMKNNKPTYKICINDNSDSFFDLLMEDKIKGKIYIDQTLDPDFPEYNDTEYIPKNKKNMDSLVKNITKDSIGIEKIIFDQYYVQGKFIDYIGEANSYDYNNWTPPINVYNNGYSQETIVDNKGVFYIVHPEETNIIRNIKGDIIGVNNNTLYKLKYDVKNKTVESLKINSFWKNLEEQSRIFYNRKYKDGKYIYNYYKTTFGKILKIISKNVDILDNRLIISYLYSRKYETVKDTIKFIAFNNVISSYNIGEALIGNKKSKITNKYINNYGDIIGILKICDEIIDYANDKLGLDIDSVYNATINNAVLYSLIEQKQIYLYNRSLRTENYTKMDIHILEILSKLDGLNKLKLSNEISKEEQVEFIKYNFSNMLCEEIIKKNNKNIKEWCITKSFNYKFVMDYIFKYIKINNEIGKYSKNIISDYYIEDEYVELSFIDNILEVNNTDKTMENKIIRTFMHGYMTNIVRNIGGINYYININFPDIKYIYTISDNKSYINFIKNRTNYLLYLSTREDNMICVNNINYEMINDICYNVFSPRKIKQYDIDGYKKNIIGTIQLINKTNNDISSTLMNNYINTINDVINDIMSHYNTGYYSKLMKMNGTRLANKRKYIKYIEQISDEDKTDNINMTGGSLIKANNRLSLNNYVIYLYKTINKK